MPRLAPLLTALTLFALPDRAVSPVHASGTQFVDAAGRPFAWRGISAFRLAERLSSGREREATAFLAWSAAHGVTVVRVLAMAKQAFALPPDRGVRVMPRLLRLARQHRLRVEVVALADTASYTFSLERHVAAIGAACATAGNCFIEIANEPYHATQAASVHDRGYLRTLRALVPSGIPVALGAAEDAKDSGGADYATVHAPRDGGGDGWGHVHAIGPLASLPASLGLPVVSDEPIGAGERLEPNRRDNDPARFEAAARATRAAGLGATFHYTLGIDARIPTGRQLACFEAWRRGLTR